MGECRAWSPGPEAEGTLRAANSQDCCEYRLTVQGWILESFNSSRAENKEVGPFFFPSHNISSTSKLIFLWFSTFFYEVMTALTISFPEPRHMLLPEFIKQPVEDLLLSSLRTTDLTGAGGKLISGLTLSWSAPAAPPVETAGEQQQSPS